MNEGYLKGCLNPYKSPLYNLPDVTKPCPDYPGESKSGLCIFPIFDHRINDSGIEHHILKSACWARRSFILFTDAMDLDIGIKFYVELATKDRVIPLLLQNKINVERDVLYFDGSFFNDNHIRHLGKKLALFGDDQFKEYQWVWQLDTDLFVSSPERKKHNLFNELLQSPLNIGANAVWPFKVHETVRDFHWHWAFPKEMSEDEKIEEWLRIAHTIAPPGAVSKYTRTHSPAHTVSGWLYSFPANHYLNYHQDASDWLTNAGRVLQDDEAVFSLWEAFGNPITDLSLIITLKTVSETPQYSGYYEGKTMCLLHLGSWPFEYYWRDAIDSLHL